MITALHYAAANNATAVLQLLIEKGVDLEAVDKYGWTALHHAAAKNHTAVLQLLIEERADLGAVDNNGNTALQLAENTGNKEAARILSSHLQASTDLRLKMPKKNDLDLDLEQELSDEDKKALESLSTPKKNQRTEGILNALKSRTGANQDQQCDYNTRKECSDDNKNKKSPINFNTERVFGKSQTTEKSAHPTFGQSAENMQGTCQADVVSCDDQKPSTIIQNGCKCEAASCPFCKLSK